MQFSSELFKPNAWVWLCADCRVPNPRRKAPRLFRAHEVLRDALPLHLHTTDQPLKTDLKCDVCGVRNVLLWIYERTDNGTITK